MVREEISTEEEKRGIGLFSPRATSKNSRYFGSKFSVKWLLIGYFLAQTNRPHFLCDKNSITARNGVALRSYHFDPLES
jgi:hypothetical protein